MSHTGMATLSCILSELSTLDCLSCSALDFESVRIIFMKLYGSVEEVVTICCV